MSKQHPTFTPTADPKILRAIENANIQFTQEQRIERRKKAQERKQKGKVAA